MSNNNNENEKNEENKLSLKIEEVDLNPDRNTFENTLRKKYSKEDVSHYFEVITDSTIVAWENKLFESKLPIHDLSDITDSDILNEVYNDPKMLKIIKGDIERTRVQESIYMPSFKDYVFQIIIYYLNNNNINYKQGLNEIAGPFVLLKYKLKLSLARIYKLFVCFIDKFLTNYFHEIDFFSLKSTFSLINILLRYHDPQLFYKFEYCMIIPDLYATSWIMTLFSNKCSLNGIYYLWDKFILFDDNLFPIFFITSFIIKNRDLYINADNSVILTILSQLEIKEKNEINEILNFSNEIRDKTPNSFYLLSNKLELFNYDSQNLEKLYNKYKPGKLLALPMFAQDIFCITHKNIIGCPDEKCENFKNVKFNNFTKCIYCRNKQFKKKLSFIIIDIRLFKNDSKGSISDSFPNGFLPKTLRISIEQLNDEKYPENILNEYKNEKDNYHFIIITSETEYFEEYEKEFYKDIEKVKKKKHFKLGIIFKKSRELDMKKVNEKFKENDKNYLLLKEFDNFKKLIDGMNKEGFKYVSFVYGGYKLIHHYAKKYNIDLLGHGKECTLCKEQLKRTTSFFNFGNLLKIRINL